MEAEIETDVFLSSGIYERLVYLGVDTAEKFVEFVHGLKCYLEEKKNENGYYGAFLRRMNRKMKDINCVKNEGYDYEMFLESLFVDKSYFVKGDERYFMLDGYQGVTGKIGEIVADFLLKEYRINKEKRKMYYEEKMVTGLAMR